MEGLISGILRYTYFSLLKSVKRQKGPLGESVSTVL